MLANAGKVVNIVEECRGKSLAVDASGWLHGLATNMVDILKGMVLDNYYELSRATCTITPAHLW